MTEGLDFLLTEDGDNLVLESSELSYNMESKIPNAAIMLSGDLLHPHKLHNLIHQHQDCETITGFIPYIQALGDGSGDYPYQNSANHNTYVNLIQEYNRKLEQCGMTGLIDIPFDGGLRSYDLTDWFSHIGFTYTFDFELS